MRRVFFSIPLWFHHRIFRDILQDPRKKPKTSPSLINSEKRGNYSHLKICKIRWNCVNTICSPVAQFPSLDIRILCPFIHARLLLSKKQSASTEKLRHRTGSIVVQWNGSRHFELDDKAACRCCVTKRCHCRKKWYDGFTIIFSMILSFGALGYPPIWNRGGDFHKSFAISSSGWNLHLEHEDHCTSRLHDVHFALQAVC